MTNSGEASLALADRYLQERRWQDALNVMRQLVDENPDKLGFTARYAHLLDAVGQTHVAIEAYAALLARRPDCGEAHFNAAGLYRKLKQYEQALDALESAIRLDIDQVEEAWLNRGVLCSEIFRAEEARSAYEQALAIDPDYVPALFNLAGLFEELGNAERAAELYERVLGIRSDYWEALARLAYISKAKPDDASLLERIQQALPQATGDGEEILCFALGKLLDDLERYDDAADVYRRANDLGKVRVLPYQRSETEQAFDQLIDIYDPDWIASSSTACTAEPIFICGMFRSGSTLLETLLAEHSQIAAGGELDLLPWLISRNLAPFPAGVRNASPDKLGRLADFYQVKVREFFPEARFITDKRPDNFMHLGLIKAMFPNAKIIHTVRDMADNCLSIFFQQFGRELGYATDLGDIAHYYRQQERLKARWIECFGDNLVTVNYEALVESPADLMRELLDKLGIEQDDHAIGTQAAAGRIRTASIWQAREAPHTGSIGRARHYGSLLEGVPELSMP